MILSPYVAYGIETTDAEKFYKKQNELYKHTATEISQENLSTYIKSILELSDVDLKKYCVEEKPRSGGGKEAKISEIIEEEEEDAEERVEGGVLEESELDYINLGDKCRITFLPLTSFNDFGVKEKYEKLFDVAYFANNAAGMLNTKVAGVLKDEALVVVESAKFMIELSNEKILGFSERMRQIASESGLKEVKFESDSGEKKAKFEECNVLKFRKV